MNIPTTHGYRINIRLKRNALLIVWLIFSQIFLAVNASESGKGSKSHVLRVNKSKSPTFSQPQPQQPSPKRENPPPPASTGILDFHTKVFLIILSSFMVIFMMILLVIGHFTWFAQMRKNLEMEWEAELQAQMSARRRLSILSEMQNPFEGRRDSIDSNGCTSRGLCIPPHHSILCPNNTSIPSLHEPFMSDSASTHHYIDDPVSRSSSSYWMNLESSVVRQPVPVNTFFPIKAPRLLVTPLSPEPAHIASTIDIASISAPNLLMNRSCGSKEKEETTGFDLSKLDMF
jgi:hypothetical protein